MCSRAQKRSINRIRLTNLLNVKTPRVYLRTNQIFPSFKTPEIHRAAAYILVPQNLRLIDLIFDECSLMWSYAFLT